MLIPIKSFKINITKVHDNVMDFLKVLLDFLCVPPRKGGGRRPFLQSKNALTMKIAGYGTESHGSILY